MNHVVAFLENWSIRQSPSGFTDEVIVLVEKEAAVFGAGWITEDIEEFIAVDMGALGAALRSGHNIRGVLIGRGVHASHSTERTLRLIEDYIGIS